MNDLISREETISYIENWKEVNKYYHPYTKNTNIPIDEVIQVIKDVPSNNQKTGHWIKDGDSYSDLYDYKIRCHCSKCGNEKFFIDRKTTSGTPCIKNCDNVDKYCSNCGAKMEGE